MDEVERSKLHARLDCQAPDENAPCCAVATTGQDLVAAWLRYQNNLGKDIENIPPVDMHPQSNKVINNFRREKLSMKWQMKNGIIFAKNVATALKQNLASLGAILTPG